MAEYTKQQCEEIRKFTIQYVAIFNAYREYTRLGTSGMHLSSPLATALRENIDKFRKDNPEGLVKLVEAGLIQIENSINPPQITKPPIVQNMPLGRLYLAKKSSNS